MEKDKLLEQYKSGYNILQNALREFPFEMWDFKPSVEKWSIKEIIVHITDSEINGYVRFRKIIAESGSTITPYNQNSWTDNLYYSSGSMDTNLEIFRLLRVVTYTLLTAIPEEKWDNHIIHPERGKVTLKENLKIYAEHVPVHINQMKRVFEDWKKINK